MNMINFDVRDVDHCFRREHLRLGACLRMTVSLYLIFEILSILSIDDDLIEIVGTLNLA